MNEEKILLAIERLEQKINSRNEIEESLKEKRVIVEKANFYNYKYLELERRIYELEQKVLYK